MPTIKKSNIFNYLKSKFSNTSSDIKMNGTQSPGLSNLIARADHIHPTDTSRAAASHTHTKSNITDFPSSMTPSSHNHGDITNAGAIGSAANKPIITGSNGKLTTGSFGTDANTFCQGNDSRLSNARTPTSHTHGEITNTGAIGSAANKPIITGSNGKLTTGSFGSSTNTFAEGNHTHTNSILSIDINSNETEFLQINWDTGMGIYGKWTGTYNISTSGTWEDKTDINTIIQNKDSSAPSIEILGTSWSSNIMYGGTGALFARVKRTKISLYSDSTGNKNHQPFTIPFFFKITE